MTIRLLTAAQAELDDAIVWYNAQAPGLGNAFLIEAIRVFDLIEKHPETWHPLTSNIRRCRLVRYPYGVIYTPEGDGQLIIAVAHLHRAPIYWRDRLIRSRP
jgi:toxin ParE2